MSERRVANSSNRNRPVRAGKAPFSLFYGFSECSPYVHIAAGACTGWVFGYVALKLSKLIALGIGSGIILMQVAVQLGVITIDETRLVGYIFRPVDTREQQSGQPVERYIGTNDGTIQLQPGSILQKAKDFVASYNRLCIAFVGGVFLGIAFV